MKNPRLFEQLNDPPLPIQLLNDRKLTREQQLMAAVLLEAVTMFTGPLRREQRRQREILELEAWFQSDDRGWPYSFRSLCDGLGFDADVIRRKLLVSREPVTIPPLLCVCKKPVHKGQCVALRKAIHRRRVVAQRRARARQQQAVA